MTQLTEKEHKAQMTDMASFDEQMPSISNFWKIQRPNVLYALVCSTI